MRSEAGYTLLELLVVLTIMGLLMSMIPGEALPRVNSLRVSGEIQDIISRLSTAREKAIRVGQPILIRTSDLAVSGVVISSSAASSRIIFFPDGSASSVTITLDYAGCRRILRIDPITGWVEHPY